MTKKAVAYARFSSENQRDESIDAQMRAINKFAEDQEIEIIKTYEDRAFSATTDDRPGFLKMIDESCVLPIDYVIVHKSDRFARNRYDSAIYKRQLSKNGIRVLSVLENFGDGPEAIMFESIIEGYNEFYSANLSREVAKGMKENAYSCKYNGGGVPLGYIVDENQNFVIDKETKEAVEIIFNDYAKGHKIVDICQKLNEKGYRTQSGKKFARTSLNRILNNEKYIGIYKTKIKGETIVIENGMPSIINEELFYKVQDLRKNKSFKSSKACRHTYLLTGLLRHECGHLVQADSGTNKHGITYNYYYCPNCNKRVRTNVVDDLFLEVFERLLFTKENIEQLVEYMYNYFSKHSGYGSIEKYNEEIKQIDKQINNVTNSIAEIGGNKILYKKLEELSNERDRLEIRRNDEELKYKPYEKEFIRDYILANMEIKKDDTKQLKGLISFMVSSIEYSSRELKISLKAIKSSDQVDLACHEYQHSNQIVITIPFAA